MDIDQELAAALTVEPSPEFVAHLRAHIAHSAAPADRSLSMMLVATGSAVLVIVIVLALSRVDRNGSASVSIGEPAAAPRSAAASASSPAAPASSGLVKKAGRVRRRDPEVLVPAHQATALRELFAALHDGRVDLAALVDTPSYTIVESDLRGEAVVPPMSIEAVVPPMSMELVRAMTNLEGARQ
jgi:hypothetical protein